MLEINNLTVAYGKVPALKEVTIKVIEGDIFTIIGANGAGKTTLLRTISGLIKPQNGDIIFAEKDVTKLHPWEIVKLGIAQVPEGRMVLDSFSTFENILLGAYRRKYLSKKYIQEDLEHIYSIFPILKERRLQRGGSLSGGEQQMLAIGRALMAKPKLLLMDEPSLGLAPLLVAEVFKIIKSLNRDENITILLVEQNARAALKLAKNASVFELGKVVMEGKANVLINDERIQVAYLGKHSKQIGD